MKKWFWKNQNEWKKQRNCCRSRYYQTQHNRLLALSGTKCHAAAALGAINDDRSTPHYVCLPPQLSSRIWGTAYFRILPCAVTKRRSRGYCDDGIFKLCSKCLYKLAYYLIKNKNCKNIDMIFLRDTESAPLRGRLHRRAL